MPRSRRMLAWAGVVSLGGLGAASVVGQDLPQSSSSPVDLQKEAGALIDGLPLLQEPSRRETSAADADAGTPSAPGAPISAAAAMTRLEQARRKQTRWEKLARQGVLSQAEAERTVMEVSGALVRYQKARLAEAEEQWQAATKQLAAGQGSADLVASAAAALASTKELAENAERQMALTRLRQAEVNADRSRRLYAERLISRHQYERAQSILAQLMAAQTPTAPSPQGR